MEQWEVLDGGKKRPAVRRQKKALEVLRVVMLVLIILMALFFFARLLSERSGAGDQTVENRNYIYQISSDAVLDMQCCNGGLAVLTNNSVLYINRSGSTSHYNGHNYSTPAICVADDRVLLYDRGGTNYRIETEGGILYEGETDAPIITAVFGEHKNYALALKTNDTRSTLQVFSRKYQLEFQWQCASEYIVSIDLSANGKKVAVGAMSANQAALYTKVHLFDVRADSPLCSYDFDSAVMSVAFLSNTEASVLCEKGLFLVSEDENTPLLDLTASDARRYAFDHGSGNSALLLAKYGSDQTGQFSVFDRHGDEKFSKDISEAVNGVAISSRYAAVAYDDRTEIYNLSGNVVGSIVFNDTAERILIDGSSVYILSANGISVFGTTAHVSVDAVPDEETTLSPEESSGDPTEETSAPSVTTPPVAVFTEAGTTAFSTEG